jgi:hypothetical protein
MKKIKLSALMLIASVAVIVPPITCKRKPNIFHHFWNGTTPNGDAVEDINPKEVDWLDEPNWIKQ